MRLLLYLDIMLQYVRLYFNILNGIKTFWLKGLLNLFFLNFCMFRFFESPDTDAFLKKSNLLDPTKHKKIVGKIDFCKICWEKNCLIGLLCNHLFCNECWSNYLSNKVYCKDILLFGKIIRFLVKDVHIFLAQKLNATYLLMKSLFLKHSKAFKLYLPITSWY